ncbi:MAG: HepT-like ribonuclease domain-containing protein [Candidatus Dormibacteraceae bacterium]
MSSGRGSFERLADIKERIENLIEDLGGDPSLMLSSRIHGMGALYYLHTLGEACTALPEELRNRYPEISWRGWKHFRNLTSHQYWATDLDLASEQMKAGLPKLVRMVAQELPIAALAVQVDPKSPGINWLLVNVGEQPQDELELENWWKAQRLNIEARLKGFSTLP